MKLNHGGRLSSTQLNEWEQNLVSLASGIAAVTDLDFVYAGTTTQELATSHPGVARSNADILVFIAPQGTGLLSGEFEGNIITRKGYIGSQTSGAWQEFVHQDVQVNTSQATASGMWTSLKKYFMFYLGRTFGLASPGDDIDTEIMSWGGWGNGTHSDPAWGEGDKIGFGLVGADNGCIN
jgi:hypothetical protein